MVKKNLNGGPNITEKINTILHKDTIFLLEKFVPEEGSVYGRIWNANDSLDYKTKNGNVELTDNAFTAETCLLIEKWDTTKIRNQERLHSNFLPVYMIYATRLVKHHEESVIDTISFKEFIVPNQ
jgi:hypothetical protein